MKNKLLLLYVMFAYGSLWSQCDTGYPKAQSPKIANYDIDVLFIHEEKKAVCHQALSWKNTSPDTLSTLRFYMYMNAFRDTFTTYLHDSRKLFGQDLSKRKADEWGHITVLKMEDSNGNDLYDNWVYIHPNDGNIKDASVMEVSLPTSLLPGQIVNLSIDFEVKLPKTIVRAGYGKDDYFLFVHWFPQVGVYETNANGEWGWNCHQFMPSTEFFADFGDYHVTIDLDRKFEVGGSGCKISEIITGDRKSITFLAHDLIDFGWVAYPLFDIYTSNYNGVDIEMLMPPEHCNFADRYLNAIEHALEYLGTNIAPYPYPKITVIDPPVHTLNSGFMEYPMMITGASFYGIPRSVRSVESLVIHEFTHMYFMATLASNEKEEAWLDEGFVTYYEDRVLDHYYGTKSSLYDIYGYRSGNAENSRLEYTGLPNLSVGSIARPGWEITSSYKGLIYAKTATMLKTLEGILSRPIMDELIKDYYQKFKFKHPKEADFRGVVKETLSKHKIAYPFDDDAFFDQCLHGVSYLDYAVKGISSSKKRGSDSGYEAEVDLERKGDMVLAVEVLARFEDGTTSTFFWNGIDKNYKHIFTAQSPIVSVHIDPSYKLYLDTNFVNNGMTLKPNHLPVYKYGNKGAHWLQSIMEWASFLM